MDRRLAKLQLEDNDTSLGDVHGASVGMPKRDSPKVASVFGIGEDAPGAANPHPSKTVIDCVQEPVSKEEHLVRLRPRDQLAVKKH